MRSPTGRRARVSARGRAAAGLPQRSPRRRPVPRCYRTARGALHPPQLRCHSPCGAALPRGRAANHAAPRLSKGLPTLPALTRRRPATNRSSWRWLCPWTATSDRSGASSSRTRPPRRWAAGFLHHYPALRESRQQPRDPARRPQRSAALRRPGVVLRVAAEPLPRRRWDARGWDVVPAAITGVGNHPIAVASHGQNRQTATEQLLDDLGRPWPCYKVAAVHNQVHRYPADVLERGTQRPGVAVHVRQHCDPNALAAP